MADRITLKLFKKQFQMNGNQLLTPAAAFENNYYGYSKSDKSGHLYDSGDSDPIFATSILCTSPVKMS